MSTASFPNIGLKPREARAAARRAEAEGKTPSEYLRSLVERDLLTGGSFGEVLRPFREAFERGGMTQEELGQAVTAARRRIHSKASRKGSK